MERLSKRHPLVLTASVFFLLLLFLVFGLCTFFLSSLAAPSREAAAAPPETRPVATVILDPGHGGADGGAVGVNGAYEKDLNLSVALGVAALLREAGVEVILTRTEDILLCGDAAKGHRKEEDLKNRLAVATAHPDAIFVSIHMNTFSVAKYSGLQVYFAPTEGSRELAERIQGTVCRQLQPTNTRRVQAAGSSIYLLDRAVGRAVLVECGFLSNPEECQRLTQKDYQSQLCFSIFYGMMEYIRTTEGEAP
ncbi:MAG: N-acetylmuramoyl-L-alanine amidase [Clostridia bacterium]|nr:N-acetylmuramoyl-L-alanine amidase [Clostridia bacterium]